jgi:hypothetical protein
MPTPILHRGATVVCSHTGEAKPVSTFSRVTVSGNDVVTLINLYSISGCSLNTPCAVGQWISGAMRVTAGGVPVAVFISQSTCIPTGAPMRPIVSQTRVLAT